MSQRPARAATPHVAAVLVAVVLTVVLLAGVLAEPAAAGEADPRDVVYLPPVEAPVSDPFRPPATTYGPGNRGLTYDLIPGTPVRAAADGLVVFAGPVAGTLHVTVLHRDGLRTSYSFLGDVTTRRGQQIAQGEVLGTAGPGFHLGARDGQAYLDPAALFDAHRVHVRLVPHTEPLPPTDAGLLREHASLRELVRTEDPGLLRRVWNGIREHAPELAGRWFAVADAAWTTWRQLNPIDVAYGVVESFLRHVLQDCTAASVAVEPPAGERVALLVAGLGSTSDHGAIDDVDVDALGYDRADVLRFSYAGGRVPATGPLHPGLATITGVGYDASDTLGDIDEQGRRLADLIVQAAAARPGVPIDVYAHSLGGVVTRVALLDLARRPGGLDALGQVVTIGSPHSGADLATLAVLSEKGFAQDVADIRERFHIEIDPYSPAVRQLAETSELMDRLRSDGVPDGVDLRTVAARGDLVVTADKADVPGHPSAIIDRAGPDAHSALPADPDTTRELQLGLAGLAPACQGFVDAFNDAVFPEVISGITDGASLGALIPT